MRMRISAKWTLVGCYQSYCHRLHICLAEHVLQKLKTLVNENTKICIVLKKVDEDLKMRKKDVDDWLRTNDRDYAVKYATLREYDMYV